MSVTEIMNQARKLPEDDFLALVREMELAAAEVVDDRFEKAVLEGKFDHLADEARVEKQKGETLSLDAFLTDPKFS